MEGVAVEQAIDPMGEASSGQGSGVCLAPRGFAFVIPGADSS